MTSGQTLYIRRAFLYLAADQAGLLRVGQTDSISGIFDNGVTTFQNFDTGGWNGDPNALPANVQVSFPFFSQQGADYGYSKFVYLSPQFAGFDVGLQYAPNTGNGAYSCAYAGVATPSTCPALSSSVTVGDGARPTNQYAAGARYQGTFGPVGLYVWGTYTGSGTVNYTGPAALPELGGPKGNVYTGKFDNQSVGFGGAALTNAGVTFGGAYQGGNYNGLGAAKPELGAKGRAWIAGVQYAAGPLVVGTSFYNYQSQGAVTLTGISQRAENWAGLSAARTTSRLACGASPSTVGAPAIRAITTSSSPRTALRTTPHRAAVHPRHEGSLVSDPFNRTAKTAGSHPAVSCTASGPWRPFRGGLENAPQLRPHTGSS